MNVPYELIDHCNNAGTIRHLAFFIKLKSFYVNGSYYNKSYSDLMRIHEVSRNQLNSYMTFFKSENWIEINGKETKFKPLRIIVAQYRLKKNPEKHNIDVNKGDKLKSIVNQLRLSILKHKNNQFQFLQSISRDKEKANSFNDVKRSIKLTNKYLNGKSLAANCNYRSSLENIGKMLNLSISGAMKFINELVKSGKLLKISSEKYLGKVWRNFSYYDELQPTYITKKGSGVLKSPNQYIFLD